MCRVVADPRAVSHGVWPPSTNRSVPVTNDASSEARNRMHAATSSGVPAASGVLLAASSGMLERPTQLAGALLVKGVKMARTNGVHRIRSAA